MRLSAYLKCLFLFVDYNGHVKWITLEAEAFIWSDVLLLLTILSWQNCFMFPSAKVQLHYCFIIMFLLKSSLHLDGKAVNLHHSLNGEDSDLFRKLRRDGEHITYLKGYQGSQSLKMQTLMVMWECSEHDLAVSVCELSLQSKDFAFGSKYVNDCLYVCILFFIHIEWDKIIT